MPPSSQSTAPINNNMPAPTSPPSAAADTYSFTDEPHYHLGRLIDSSLLFAFAASIGIFFTVLFSPMLAGVRRTYMEFGTPGRLACASLFIVGLLLLTLSLFWILVHAGVALRTRRRKMRRHVQGAAVAGFAQAQRDALGLQQNLLADMRRHGSSDEEMAQVRALIESVNRKVAVQSRRQIAEYEKNSDALTRDIRAMAERLERGEILEGGFRRAI
jgi:hypothetical protein